MNDRTKVAIILPSFDIGGTENMVANLVKYINKARFEVLVISLAYPLKTHVQRMIEASGVQIRYGNKGKTAPLKVFFEVCRALTTFNPDIIHSNMYAFAFAIPYLMTHRIKLLHTVHNKPTNEFKDKYKRLISFLYKINKAIPVAISHIVEKEMSEAYSNLEVIERVYNPVETKKFATNRKLTQRTDITFVNVARFMKQKNQGLLIDAFVIAKHIVPDIKLLFVGDGELREELEKRIKKYQIEESVTLVGNVSNVNHYLAKSDVFILSSDYEGLPLSILEAMASGLPIISTDVGGVADIVTNNGILVEARSKEQLASAMIKMVLEPNYRYQLGLNSEMNSSQFDSSEFIKQYEYLYEKYRKEN